MSDTVYLNSFFSFLTEEKRYSEHTVVSYRNDLGQLIEFFADTGLSVVSCTQRDLRNWIIELSSIGLSPSSIARKVTSCKSLFKYLRRIGKREDNPATNLKTPKKEKKIPEFVQKTDLTQLLDHQEFDFSNFSELRSYLIVTLLYTTGMRRAEIVGLKDSDIDLVKNYLKVTGKGNKERLIPFTSSTNDLIKKYLKEKGDVISDGHDFFIVTNKGEKSYPGLIYSAVKSTLGKVTSQKKRSPHVLRHSFATHLLDKGADLNAIKELLGHANLAATQVYTHSSLEKLKETFSQAHPKS